MASSSGARQFVITAVMLFSSIVGAEWWSRAVGPTPLYREWELLYDAQTTRFKPNEQFESVVYGDLARTALLPRFRMHRTEQFTTDAYGFRNPPAPAGTAYPVVVVGDSNIVGSGSTNEHTFTADLERLLGVPVYNYGADGFRNVAAFFRDPRFRQSPPAVLVWQRVEHKIWGPEFAELIRQIKAEEGQEDAEPPPRLSFRRRLSPRLQRTLAEMHVRSFWREAAILTAATIRYALWGKLNSSVVAATDARGTPWLFHEEEISCLLRTAETGGLPKAIDSVAALQEICRRRGIQLVFLPLPDKANMYRDLLSPSYGQAAIQDGFLSHLVQGVRGRGVPVVDLASAYRAARRASPHWLYWPDDTHWSPLGMELAAQETARLLASDTSLARALRPPRPVNSLPRTPRSELR